MDPVLIAAAEALAATLARENAALSALDLAGAAALLGEKSHAAAAFAAALRAAPPATALAGGQRRIAEQLAGRLRDLATDNRRLLERAIFVQGRVLGTIARALPKAAIAPRYGARGVLTQAGSARPYSLSARA